MDKFFIKIFKIKLIFQKSKFVSKFTSFSSASPKLSKSKSGSNSFFFVSIFIISL